MRIGRSREKTGLTRITAERRHRKKYPEKSRTVRGNQKKTVQVKRILPGRQTVRETRKMSLPRAREIQAKGKPERESLLRERVAARFQCQAMISYRKIFRRMGRRKTGQVLLRWRRVRAH